MSLKLFAVEPPKRDQDEQDAQVGGSNHLLFRIACYRDPDLPSKSLNDAQDAADFVTSLQGVTPLPTLACASRQGTRLNVPFEDLKPKALTILGDWLTI